MNIFKSRFILRTHKRYLFYAHTSGIYFTYTQPLFILRTHKRYLFYAHTSVIYFKHTQVLFILSTHNHYLFYAHTSVIYFTHTQVLFIVLKNYYRILHMFKSQARLLKLGTAVFLHQPLIVTFRKALAAAIAQSSKPIMYTIIECHLLLTS